MKLKEKQELRGKSSADLAKILLEEKKKLGELKFNLQVGKTKNTGDVKKIKKTIARISTFIHEK